MTISECLAHSGWTINICRMDEWIVPCYSSVLLFNLRTIFQCFYFVFCWFHYQAIPSELLLKAHLPLPTTWIWLFSRVPYLILEKAMATHSSTLAGKSHGQRRLEGCSPWRRWGLDTTEWLHCHFSLSCIGEGNGNPLQCSCLENPRVGGAWWAAVSGVAPSRKRLKWHSSSSHT